MGTRVQVTGYYALAPVPLTVEGSAKDIYIWFGGVNETNPEAITRVAPKDLFSALAESLGVDISVKKTETVVVSEEVYRG